MLHDILIAATFALMVLSPALVAMREPVARGVTGREHEPDLKQPRGY